MNYFSLSLGTYSDKHYLTKSSECQSCPRGSYCGFEGRTTWTGPCDAGFYCIGGASVKTPQDNTTGYRCPKGIWNLSTHMALKVSYILLIFGIKSFLAVKIRNFGLKLGQIVLKI